MVSVKMYNVSHSPHSHRRHFANKSLSELVDMSAVAHETDASQADWDKTLLASNRIVWRLCGHRCHPHLLDRPAALQRAINNLARFALVGSLEHFPTFAQQLLLLTATPPTVVQRPVVSPSYPSLFNASCPPGLAIACAYATTKYPRMHCMFLASRNSTSRWRTDPSAQGPARRHFPSTTTQCFAAYWPPR